MSRRDTIDRLRRLVGSRHLLFSAVDRVVAALDAFETGKGDFSDYLIREESRFAGCEVVVTLDAALLREPGFSGV